MGGVSVRHLAALSGSSAEHVELLLDDGFTALADSLEWSVPACADGPDLSFDWVAEALADTAARLPEQIRAPLPTGLLRNATVVRWSIRAVPVAVGAACAAVIAAVAQPSPAELHVQDAPAVYGSQAEGGPLAGQPDLGFDPAEHVDSPADPPIRMRSIALTALLDTPTRSFTADASDAQTTAPRQEGAGKPPP
jgi:hypothetical protein